MNNIDLEKVEIIKADTILKTIASSYDGFKESLKLFETGQANFDGIKVKAQNGVKFDNPLMCAILVYISGIVCETNQGCFVLTDEQMKEIDEVQQILKIKMSLEKLAKLGLVKETNQKDKYGFNSYIVAKDKQDLINELLKKEGE